MGRREIAEEIAERLRQEPYHLLWNDCLIKAMRFKEECARRGIKARVVAGMGLGRAHLFGRWRTIPVLHGWGEVEGRRVEVSRPLGASGVWGIVPRDIRPVWMVRF